MQYRDGLEIEFVVVNLSTIFLFKKKNVCFYLFEKGEGSFFSWKGEWSQRTINYYVGVVMLIPWSIASMLFVVVLSWYFITAGKCEGAAIL